ncbi:MAG: MarR family transcriptional regulator [Rhodospirillales bacterium]
MTNIDKLPRRRGSGKLGHDLSPRQLAVLGTLASTNASAMSQLVARLSFSKSGVLRVLRELERLELIERGEHPLDDRRMRPVAVTTEGHQLLAALWNEAVKYIDGLADAPVLVAAWR